MSEATILICRADQNVYLNQNAEFVLLHRPTFALLITILPP